jgi:hypothetical protein
MRDLARRPNQSMAKPNHAGRAAAISRGHTTRFFTIVHQQPAPRDPQGIPPGQFAAAAALSRNQSPEFRYQNSAYQNCSGAIRSRYPGQPLPAVSDF